MDCKLGWGMQQAERKPRVGELLGSVWLVGHLRKFLNRIKEGIRSVGSAGTDNRANAIR